MTMAANTPSPAPRTPVVCQGVGCLLIHGFSGSPRELLGLRHYLESAGVTVSLPTLPGHDTSPADMFNYTWQDWFSWHSRQVHTPDRSDFSAVLRFAIPF